MNTNQNEIAENEQELVEGLINSDQQTFSRIYDKFSSSLFSMILGWIKDAEVAENLLQDVFLRAWMSRQRYDQSRGRLFTWLYKISRNICIDYYRSRRYKQTRALVAAEDLTNTLCDKKDSNGSVDAIALRDFVDCLRQEEKEVIDLMYFKGFTQCEIAKLLCMPLGTVKTRANRAVKNLRRIFMNDWDRADQYISLN
jgi:RNA polymerase sigma-70 factor (ECF subfamily)